MDCHEDIVLEILKHADPKTQVISKQVCKALSNEFAYLTTRNILCLKFVLSMMTELIYNEETPLKYCEIYKTGTYQIEKTRILYKDKNNEIVFIHFGCDKTDVPKIIYKFTPPPTDKELTVSFVLKALMKSRNYKKIKNIICKLNNVYFDL